MATYYIDFVAGSDSNNGTSTSTPWKRVKGDSNATGTAAGATLAAGDTIVFKGGVVYLGGFTISTSGTSGNPIVYDGSGATWGTGKAIIDREYLRNGVCINLAKSVSHVTVKGFELRHAGGWADDDPVVTGANNTTPITTNTGGTGISLYSWPGGNSHVLIEDIYAHRIGGWRNTAGWQRIAIQGSAVQMLNANNITVRGIEVTKTSVGVRVASTTSTDNIVVEDCDMHNYIMWGVDVTANATNAAFSNIHIRRNSIYNTAEFDDGNWSGVPNDNHPHTNGVFVRRNPYDSTWENVRIYENRFWCDDRGSSTGGTACVFVSSGPSVIIYNNVMDRDAKTRGISIAYPNKNTQKQVVRIYNNFIRTTGAIGIENAGEADPAKREIHIQNNILLQAPGTNANWQFLYNNVSPLPDTLNNNIYLSVGWNVSQKFILSPNWSKFADLQAAGFEANGAYIDPLIVDLSDSPVANNNRLLTASSPARSAGANLSSFFSTDAAGNSRPTSGAWDVGPFQYQPPVTTHHVTQSGAGSANGTSEANAWSVADFNTSGNWSSTVGTSGKISPGDTVMLHGTFTSGIIVRGSGQSANRITILFADNAKFSAPAFNGIVIDVGQRSYVTIDGGTNGIIENTDNGTPGSFGNTVNTTGVRIQQAVGVHVTRLLFRNLYQRTSTTDANYSAGSSGIEQKPSNAIYGFSGTRISYCTFHDMSRGVGFTAGDTSGDIEVHDCTIYNVDDGVVMAPGWNDRTLDGAKVYRNRIYGFSKWDDANPANQWHHDGVHVFAVAPGSSYHNVHVFNNVIGPDYGNRATSGIYMSGYLGNGNLIYQNILFSKTGDNPNNGQIFTRPGPGSGTLRIYNNVSLGEGQGVGISITGQDSGAARSVTLANNIAVGITAVAVYYHERITLTSNRNLLYDAPSSFPGAYVYSIGNNASPRTIEQWQALGFDADSVYADPLLTETYRLGAGSPARSAGANLSSFFTTDAAGNTRPASGAWDIGAFQYGEAPPPTPPAARGRKRRGAKLLSFFR
jgi:hypothetical protein